MVAEGKTAGKAPINSPTHVLIAESLFRIANSPDPKKRGSVRRATQAQKMIMDRMVGIRLPGSNPAAKSSSKLDFVDLTTPALGGSSDPRNRADEVPEENTGDASEKS